AMPAAPSARARNFLFMHFPLVLSIETPPLRQGRALYICDGRLTFCDGMMLVDGCDHSGKVVAVAFLPASADSEHQKKRAPRGARFRCASMRGGDLRS